MEAVDPFNDIRRSIARRFGASARIEDIVVPTLGGSNRTVAFDLVQGATRRRLVSRQQTFTGENSPFMTIADQFRIMQIAHARGLPVPEPIFAYDADDATEEGFVAAFVAGETIPKRILQSPALAEIRPRLAAQLAEILAALHAIDTGEVAFLAKYRDSAAPLAAQRERFDSYQEAHPAIEVGLRWLELHRPPPSRPRLVHGDFRTGNFIIAADGVQAVLDWECCHLGSAVEDIGWLCTRSWRFGNVELPVGGLGRREPFLAAYIAAGGEPVDLATVRYWEIFGLVRWAALNVMQAHAHVFGGRRSAAFAACGRNAAIIEYELLMTLLGHYD